jgi:DNA primase
VPAADVSAEVREHEVVIELGERRFRVRGLARNLSFEQLRINLLVASGDHFHVDSLDLYSARQRGAFLKQASEELQVKQETLKRDLGKVLLKLEQLQEEQIRKALEPKAETVVLSEADRAEAMKLLKDPQLLDRISADFSTCGLVGEHTNKLVGYLAAVSRKLDRPLAVLVQSSSAAGKSALMEAILAFVPEEERVHYSAMTAQSLFYMGETDLKHKVLAIAEEEGAERASYPLKLLQSEGELTIASTGKDPSSGRLVTHEYHVEGPAAILLTTTAIDLDEELQNRCLVLAVDESREQTIAIHQAQRLSRTREGAIRKRRRPKTLTLHRNAQRLLRPLEIRNPYSPDLTFLNKTTRTRRDQEKYLSLIDAVALLHQHQRQVKTEAVDGERVEYIEVTLDDIAAANRLAAEALGRMLDELPPQTRLFLDQLRRMVLERCEQRRIEQPECRFSRWELCQATGWTYPQVRRHLDRLVDMEYVLVHHGGQGARFVYELLWSGEGADGTPFVMGLIDVERLRHASTTTLPTASAVTSSKPTLTPSETTLTPRKPDFDPRLTPACPPLDPRLTPGHSEHNSSEDSTSKPGNGKTQQKRTSGPGREAGVVGAPASYAARGRR